MDELASDHSIIKTDRIASEFTGILNCLEACFQMPVLCRKDDLFLLVPQNVSALTDSSSNRRWQRPRKQKACFWHQPLTSNPWRPLRAAAHSCKRASDLGKPQSGAEVWKAAGGWIPGGRWDGTMAHLSVRQRRHCVIACRDWRWHSCVFAGRVSLVELSSNSLIVRAPPSGRSQTTYVLLPCNPSKLHITGFI